MKSTKKILAGIIFTFLVSVAAVAGNKAKVIAVVNKADWCPVCQKNGMRAMDTFKENNKDMSVVFVMNDLTNDETKKQSSVELKKLGLVNATSQPTSTGMVHFFNSETKEKIAEVSVAKSNDELINALQATKGKLK